MSGECNLNPRYMLEHCPVSCGRLAELDNAIAEEIGEITCVWAFVRLTRRTTRETPDAHTMYA